MEAKLIKMLEGYIVSLTGDIDDIYAITNKELTEEHGFYSLSLKNCKEVENGYDLDEIIEQTKLTLEDSRISSYDSFRIGMETILEILGDKKFNEEDVILIAEYIRVASQSTPSVRAKDLFDEYQSLQQNEWDVEIVTTTRMENGKSGLDVPVEKPKLDADGNLILKRK